MLSEAQIFDTFWGKTEKKAELKLLKEREGWFSILHLPPSERTRQFADIFTKTTREIIRRYLDERGPVELGNGAVKDWNPIKSGDIFDITGMSEEGEKKYLAKMKALIRARQFCDNHGIPYDFACKVVIKLFYFEKSYLRKFSKLPQPRLFLINEIKEHLILAWADSVRSKIQIFDDESMKIGDNPSKIALRHQDWVIAQIGIRATKTFAAKNMLSRGFVTIEALEKAGINI